jgi:rhomboid protease GluP
MDGEIDYTKYDESELVDMFSRTDPRWAPINCARLKQLLVDRGYIVRDGGLGPGSAVPSPEKLQSLIGSASPIECKVTFAQKAGPFRWLEPSHNDFDFGDSGTLVADGIHLQLSGRRAGLPGLFGSLFQRRVQLSWRGIVDVELDENVVHFAYHTPVAADGAITLWLPDRCAAEQLAAVLPKERTENYRPQLKVHADFERNLIAQSPKTPVTVVLVAINALVFVAMGIGGAGWFIPNPVAHLAWGSNFGPYTADGEWWRLFTSLFIHFGALHLLFNMWALGIFGPLVERLYGSINYLCIYLASGLAGSLASLSWNPELNSAGASGAILGILGAMLAAQLRTGKSFPSNIVRPLRNTTLVFLGWTLYAGFTSKGIDNAAHLGGLAAGFITGLAAARPVTGESSYSRSDLRHLIQLASAAVVVLAVGFWFAQRASASMVGEGLYRRTAHWIGVREPLINGKFNTALSLDVNDRRNHSALIETLEKDVIPFWREAGDRLATIQLSSNSPNRATLGVLQDLTHGRADGYQSLDDGLRRNDPETIAKAGKDLKQVEQTARERRATRQ